MTSWLQSPCCGYYSNVLTLMCMGMRICVCVERERETHPYSSWNSVVCTAHIFSNKSKSSQKLVIHLRLNIYVADWWKLYITLQMNTNKHYMYKDCHPIEIILA